MAMRRTRPASMRGPGARSPRLRLGFEGVAELVRTYSAGETSTSLAKRMGVSKQSVVKILREEGVAIRCQPLSESQRTESVRRYAAGESIRQVAAQVGCDYETVRQVLLASEMKVRPRTGGT